MAHAPMKISIIDFEPHRNMLLDLPEEIHMPGIGFI